MIKLYIRNILNDRTTSKEPLAEHKGYQQNSKAKIEILADKLEQPLDKEI